MNRPGAIQQRARHRTERVRGAGFCFVELRGLASTNKELLAGKVHSLERKVSVHEHSIVQLADAMAELMAAPAPPPKRPIGFITPKDKGKKTTRAKGKA